MFTHTEQTGMFTLMIVAALIKDNNLCFFAALLANSDDKFDRDCFVAHKSRIMFILLIFCRIS